MRKRGRPRKKKRSLSSILTISLYIFAALGLLLSYWSPLVNPSHFWPIAFFGLAYPFFVVINIGFAVFWLIRRRRRFWFPFILLLLGWGYHKQNFAFRFNSQVTLPDSSIRVMSYNAHHFTRNGKDFNEKAKTQMLAIIAAESPDIIAIQEFYTRPEGVFDIKDSLEQIFGTSYHYIHEVLKNDFESRGLAIFSKYPIGKTKTINIAGHKSTNTCTVADIEINGRTIRFFNVHLQSISFQPEDYQYISKVKDQLDPNVSSSKRIGNRLKTAFIRRAAQADSLAGIIQSSPHPIVVCGDFNDTPMSYAFQTIKKTGLQSAFAQKGSGYATTYEGVFPSYQIDHILCSEEAFEVLSYHVTPKKLSDHYPIRSDIVFK